MSRKAMKKTLERLHKTAVNSLETYHQILEETAEKRVTQIDLDYFQRIVNEAISDIINYTNALNDAYSEFAEGYDKLEAIKLEKMKKAVEDTLDKSVKKKENAKGTRYIS